MTVTIPYFDAMRKYERGSQLGPVTGKHAIPYYLDDVVTPQKPVFFIEGGRWRLHARLIGWRPNHLFFMDQEGGTVAIKWVAGHRPVQGDIVERGHMYVNSTYLLTMVSEFAPAANVEISVIGLGTSVPQVPVINAGFWIDSIYDIGCSHPEWAFRAA